MNKTENIIHKHNASLNNNFMSNDLIATFPLINA